MDGSGAGRDIGDALASQPLSPRERLAPSSSKSFGGFRSAELKAIFVVRGIVWHMKLWHFDVIGT
jgi:hypothetical protein